jgi:hypothetical protein
MRLIKAASAAAVLGVALGGWKSFEDYAAKPAQVPVVTLVARDFAFDSIPDIPAGVVEIRLHNEGPTLHHAALIKLNDGKTVGDLIAALKNPGPPPRWAVPVPSPNAPAPGEYANVTTRLTPGDYAVLCFVDIGGTPHFMKGMSRAFKVVPSHNNAVEPKSDLRLTTFDYGFKFSKPLTAGHHIIRIESTGKQEHEVELVQLAPGKKVEEMLAWIGGDMKSPPPGKPMAGVLGIMPGHHASFDITLTPGNWGLICFVPDMKDGKPHFMHGMVTQVAVK